jgi:hypothetical protein
MYHRASHVYNTENKDSDQRCNLLNDLLSPADAVVSRKYISYGGVYRLLPALFTPHYFNIFTFS